MTTKAKYAYWSVGGAIFWGVVFCVVGCRILEYSLRSVILAYAILLAILFPTQVAMYRSEQIPNYRTRLRRRMELTGYSGLAGWAALLAWLLGDTSISWPLVLICWLGGLAVGLAALWLAYRSALRWQLGSRPKDDFS